ncbi:hypothetical protein EFL81_10125 [Weissella confusa]|nr:hypothetical protein [Weissella confusa]
MSDVVIALLATVFVFMMLGMVIGFMYLLTWIETEFGLAIAVTLFVVVMGIVTFSTMLLYIS